MSNPIPVRSVGEFLVYTGKSYLGHDCQQSAAALTYATLFAFVPLLTVIYKVLSLFPALHDSGRLINDFVLKHMMPDTGTQIVDHLDRFSSQAGNLTVVGLLVLFITAILMIRKIERTFNKIWQVEEPRKGIMSIMLYWSVLSLGTILLGIGLAISSFLASMSLFVEYDSLLSLQTHILAVLPFVTSSIAFALMYTAVPNCYVPFRSALAGGILAAFLFESAKHLFALFATSFSSYKLIYGAFAAVPLFILWVYLSWNIVLFGVEWVRCLVVFKPEEFKKDHHPLLTLLRIIQFCLEKQHSGDLVSQEELRNYLYTLPNADWGELRQILLDNNIMQRTETGDFAVVADLHSLTLYDLVKMTPWSISDLEQLSAYKPEENWEKEVVNKWMSVSEKLRDNFQTPVYELLAQVANSGETGKQPASLASSHQV